MQINFSEFKTFATFDLSEQKGQVNPLNADRAQKQLEYKWLLKV